MQLTRIADKVKSVFGVSAQTVAVHFQKRTAASQGGILGGIIAIAVGLILFATIGIIGLQLLATAGTTSFQTTVVLLSITVVSVFAAIGVAIYFLRHIHL